MSVRACGFDSRPGHSFFYKKTLSQMNVDIPLLSKLCETPGAPGFEDQIRKLVVNTIESHVDDIQIDAMGNVTAVKRSGSVSSSNRCEWYAACPPVPAICIRR